MKGSNEQMGLYTSLRFKGIVKLEFRDEIKSIAFTGYWNKSNDDEFRKFGKYPRAYAIPYRTLECECVPDDWRYVGNISDRCSYDGFKDSYDEQTGQWSFQCSLKDYDKTIEKFIKLIPYFIESADMIEVYYEASGYLEKYILENNTVVLVENDNEDELE